MKFLQEVNAVTDNAAVLQQRVTKGTNVFLARLAKPGEAQFLTVLKPCGILLPHTHQRANEFYSVLFGAFRSRKLWMLHKLYSSRPWSFGSVPHAAPNANSNSIRIEVDIV